MHRHKAHVRELDDYNYERILDSLKKGPVAIGENHGSKSARAMVLRLLDSGSVKQLFIECIAPEKRTDPISQEDMFMLRMFLTPSDEHTGDKSIYAIINTALEKNIEVYCFDYWKTDKKWMTSDEGMNARDDIMSHCYIQVVKNNGVGALLLNGAAHLSSSSGHYDRQQGSLGSLARKCRISKIFQFDWNYKKDDPSKKCGEPLF